MGRLARGLFGISPEETSFARRGFRCDEAEIRHWLEQVGTAFVDGYLLGLEEDRPEPLAARLEREVDASHRGFAFEGAGMALAILDAVAPWRRDRLRRFVAGPANDHIYLVYCGVGFALGRLPLSPARTLARLDPVLGWLALDGYGFHQGFFHGPRAVDRQEVPRRLAGYARRAFDHGLGRSLWFVEGASVERLAATIGAFAEARQSDLWSGVGLAATYAGGRDREGLAALRQAAGEHRDWLAQGSSFAAEARRRGGNPTPHSALACQVLCGRSFEASAQVAEEAGRDLPGDGAVPAYEVWRRRVVERLAARQDHPGASDGRKDTVDYRESSATA